jgi:hypothetical protein
MRWCFGIRFVDPERFNRVFQVRHGSDSGRQVKHDKPEQADHCARRLLPAGGGDLDKRPAICIYES